MVFKHMLMKTKWYPRPHDNKIIFNFGLESGVVNSYCHFPALMYDEGLGAPSTYEANPEHASFAEYKGPNCFPDSRISNFFLQMEFQLTKEALETDKLHNVNLSYMPILMAFKEDYLAQDELSTSEVQDIYGLQTEATDRQGSPLYNNVKLNENFTGSALLGADVPAMDTTQAMEAVVFSRNDYYDMLNYGTISGKLKATNAGMRHVHLSRQHPRKVVNVGLDPKVKRMNAFTLCTILIGAEKVATIHQPLTATATTDISHIVVTITQRFLEWHQGFNMERV